MQRKLTIKQKLFQFLCVPIQYFSAVYLFNYLSSYIFNKEMATVIETSVVAIGLSIAHWIHLVYPSKPRNDSNEHKKSLKEYVKQYVIKGSPFNKLTVIIYSLSAIIVIIVVWLIL